MNYKILTYISLAAMLCITIAVIAVLIRLCEGVICIIFIIFFTVTILVLLFGMFWETVGRWFGGRNRKGPEASQEQVQQVQSENEQIDFITAA